MSGPDKPGDVRRISFERDELTVALSRLREERAREAKDLIAQIDRTVSQRDSARTERNAAQTEAADLRARLNAMNKAVIGLHKATKTNAGEEAEWWREINRLLQNK